MIETLKISNSLQEHQFSREQAEAIAAAIAEVAGAELVTRKDLDLARGALELAIERLRGSVNNYYRFGIHLC
jgi:Cdc6-like AAA superfamily ATPase